MNNKTIIKEIYELCKNSTYENACLYENSVYPEIGGYDAIGIELNNLRDLALDGGYENDEEAYLEMIEKSIDELVEQHRYITEGVN
jgi:hypothetical protein